MTPLALALLTSPPAAAHGGFHQSLDVGEVTSAQPDPTVVSTYGLMAPVEGSEDWSWVCEEVAGPAGFGASLQVGGRWLLATFDGVLRSDDLCDWQLVEGPLQGLYVTGLYADATVTDRLWATSASGDATNALWRSDDRGESWTAHATFGEEVTLRGMAQAPTGLPMWAVGWDDVQPTAWVTADGDTWTPHALPSTDVYSVSMLGAAEGVAWLRLVGAETDTLLRLDADGAASAVLAIEDTITAFDAGPAAGELYVGGTTAGLYHSADGGQTWQGPSLAPQPGCLRTRGGERYVCAHNWADGAAVLRTPLQGGDPATWTWEPVLWFGDVRTLHACPADSVTAVACATLWENASPEAGFDQERDDTDGGAAGDSGDTGDAPPADPGGCCSGGGAGALLLPGLLGLALRRRRPQPRARK